jgi:hypothetical protein
MKRFRANPIAFVLIGIPVILLIVTLATLTAGAAASASNQIETPMAEATLQPAETPSPGGWSLESGTPSPGEIPGSGGMGMGNCPMMSGGMPGMNMTGMAGMMMPGMPGMTSIASSSPYENPWYLLGWALLALVSLTILCGPVFGFVWIIRSSKSVRKTAGLPWAIPEFKSSQNP